MSQPAPVEKVLSRFAYTPRWRHGIFPPIKRAEAVAFNDLGAHAIEQLRDGRVILSPDHINDNRGFGWIVAAPANADTLDSRLRHQRRRMAFFHRRGLIDVSGSEHRRLAPSRILAHDLGSYSVHHRRNRSLGCG